MNPSTSVATEPVTAEDLYGMGSQKRCELVQGVIIPINPVGVTHGRIVLNVGALLKAYVQPRQLGTLSVGDPGVILQRDPDTVLAPDVLFIAREREPQRSDGHRFLETPPTWQWRSCRRATGGRIWRARWTGTWLRACASSG